MTTMQKHLQHSQITFLMAIIYYKIHKSTIQNQIIIYAIQACIIIFLITNQFIQIILFSVEQQY